MKGTNGIYGSIFEASVGKMVLIAHLGINYEFRRFLRTGKFIKMFVRLYTIQILASYY